ncbi:MAG: DUF1385 domain-containing protein [Clostridiales bacterium]|nr:DUF1385 domain-containing protein [Clostridiales bacterium]
MEIYMNKKTSIGGQALIEGIMMRGPEITAMAVRNPEGEIIIETEPTIASKAPRILKLPLIRGIYNMIMSFKLGYKYLMRSAEIAGLDEIEAEETSTEKNPEKEKNNKWIMGLMMIIATVLGVCLAVGLFMFLPVKLFEWLRILFPSIPDSSVLKSVFEGVIKIVIFVGYMACMRLMKDIRRTFMYHGAEHKTIFCYEAGEPLTVENIRRQKKYHPRCGTSFMILILLVSIIISMFIPKTIFGVEILGIYRVLLKLLVLPLIVGIGYELIKIAGRWDNAVTKIISFPGMLLQHISVIEPDDDMIECAIAAMEKVIPSDPEKDNW